MFETLPPRRCARLSRAALPTVVFLVVIAVWAGLGGAASAQTVDQSFPFELERWYRVDHTSGPITVHRLRLTHTEGGIASRIKRDERYEQQVTLELEFSNSGDADWKCQTEIQWTDEDGLVIEGIDHRFELDDRETREIRKEAKAVLRYGLQRARNVNVKLRLDPD